jgi:hypothetical protein
VKDVPGELVVRRRRGLSHYIEGHTGWSGIGIAVLLLLPAAVAAATTLAGGSPEQLVGLTSLAAAPAMLWAAIAFPEALVGVIVFGQILGPYGLTTPIGNITPGTVGLLILLWVKLPEIADTVRKPGYVLAAALTLALVAATGLQLLHVPASQAARIVITAAGFGAYMLLGMYVGSRPRYLAAAGLGASVGLVLLGLSALVANSHLIPGFVPGGTSRQILGFASPFVRTTGLRSDTDGLLLALAIPWLAIVARFPNRLSVRVGALATLAAIELAALLLFQSRSMVLEGALAPVIVWTLADRQILPAGIAGNVRGRLRASLRDRRAQIAAAGAIAIVIGTMFVAAQLVIGDKVSNVSTQIRADTYSSSLSYFLNHPWTIIVGADQTAFYVAINHDMLLALPVGNAIPASTPVHNFLIERVVAGGIIAGVSALLLSTVPLLTIIRKQLDRGTFTREAATVVAAVVVVVLEASVTATNGNAGALWITLGWGVAVAATYAAHGVARTDQSHR